MEPDFSKSDYKIENKIKSLKFEVCSYESKESNTVSSIWESIIVL